jgi:hypothetical protein
MNLLTLGVDVAQRVRLVVATHWHDDNVRGLADLLCAAKSATFACSLALQASEFLHLLELGQDAAIEFLGSGVEEIRGIRSDLKSRNGSPEPAYALENRILWRGNVGNATSVIALAPSDKEVKLALQRFAELARDTREYVLRFPSQGPNNASVVLSIQIDPDIRILLGGDLEHRQLPGVASIHLA